MAQAIVTPTASQQAAAEALLAEPSRWTSARRKSDGKPFSIVRGRTGVYFTTPDACTCPGFTRRGICSHSLASTMRQAREAAQHAATELPVVRRTRYEDLFPADA